MMWLLALRLPAARWAQLWIAGLVALASVLPLSGCSRGHARPYVVIYVAVDQAHAEPVLARFERETGIEVRAVYDVEATKSAGLAQRILAERSHPQADVTWNGEVVQTLRLAAAGALAPYRSPNVKDLPPEVVAPGDLWAGQAGRMRVLLVHASVPSNELPVSFLDLLSPRVPGREAGLSHPVFGTSATHAAALYALLGADKARQTYEQIRQRGVRILDGNSVVRDLVSRGEIRFGLVDTDDACEAIRQGAPVRMVVPDQMEGGWGALVIPTTVAMIAGAPHGQQARSLIDFLLSREVESMLVTSGWSHAPYRSLEVTPPCFDVRGARRMAVTPTQIATFLERAHADMRATFVR